MTNVVTSSGTVRRSVPVRVRADIPWNRGLHSAPNVRAARSTRLQVRPPRLGIVRSSRRRAANGQYPVGHRLVGHRNCSMRRPSVPPGPKEGDIGKALHAGLGGLIGLVIVLFLYSVIGLLPNSRMRHWTAKSESQPDGKTTNWIVSQHWHTVTNLHLRITGPGGVDLEEEIPSGNRIATPGSRIGQVDFGAVIGSEPAPRTYKCRWRTEAAPGKYIALAVADWTVKKSAKEERTAAGTAPSISTTP